MKALAFGNGAEQRAEHLWPEATIEVPAWNYFDPPRKQGRKYEGIVAYFVLQRAANRAVVDTLKAWRHLLKPGGELHVHVPSAEWFAREILSAGQPSRFALEHLLGLQVDENTFNLSAFTMSRLRRDLSKAGFAVRQARAYPYQISVNGDVYKAEQHHVMGVKV